MYLHEDWSSRQYLQSFEVKCAYPEQFGEGWRGWTRVKEKKEIIRKSARGKKVKIVKGLVGHQEVSGFYSE